ncbi:hypothetical protein L209DRAFT_752294 [Thermothelomyces heterothallicus CBS 203.75]
MSGQRLRGEVGKVLLKWTDRIWQAASEESNSRVPFERRPVTTGGEMIMQAPVKRAGPTLG